jgi:hypothetical protein
MAGTIVVDRLESDASYASTINVASKVNFSAGMQIGGQDTTLGGMRNRIINGAMNIDQRRSGSSLSITDTTNGHYTLDRWLCGATSASKYSVQQNAGSVTPPTGFSRYLGITSSSAYSVVSSDIFSVQQRFEGFNVADLAWGTANAQPVTISFWVRSSITGLYGGSLRSGGFDRASPFSYTINSANTWEYKTITITGCTDGSWDTSTNNGGGLLFSIAAGATYQASTGIWNTGSGLAPTGQTNLLGTNGATWYITGVQLEKGSAASPFEYRQHGQELALCQRYFISYGQTTGYERFGVGVCNGTTTTSISTFLPVQMRAQPTLTFSSAGHFGVYDGGNVYAVTAISTDQQSEKVYTAGYTVASGLTQYRPAILVANNTASAKLSLSAEL